MAHIGFILASTQGGLYAVAEEAGLEIIDGTEVEFDSIASYSDVRLSTVASFDSGKSGWSALAIG